MTVSPLFIFSDGYDHLLPLQEVIYEIYIYLIFNFGKYDKSGKVLDIKIFLNLIDAYMIHWMW